jgi:antirestriction protein ArdC
MTKERFDIHQHITDKIVSAIERGAGDFRLPWHRSAGSIMRPVNIASKKAYRGVNVVALWAYAEEFGYSSGTWGIYKQWSEAGAQVRKGEKAAFVVFYKELEFAADPEAGDAETATRLFARATPVIGYPLHSSAVGGRRWCRTWPVRRRRLAERACGRASLLLLTGGG